MTLRSGHACERPGRLARKAKTGAAETRGSHGAAADLTRKAPANPVAPDFSLARAPIGRARTGLDVSYHVPIASAQAQRRAASPGSHMILPRRQQAILDQMERALGAADPQLRSSYAAFARRAEGVPFPAAEVIAPRPVRFLVLALVILLVLGFLAWGISDVSGGCPSAVWHGVCAAPSGRA